jgi:hypothetical protein
MTRPMDTAKFEVLAEDLARQHGDLPRWLASARSAAEDLRAQAQACIDAFLARARTLGAEQLGGVRVSPVGYDQKHVDCVQFSIERGRNLLLCVAIANAQGGKMRLVGPFKQGKAEGPCGDFPLRGPELEQGLELRMLDLLRQSASL